MGSNDYKYIHCRSAIMGLVEDRNPNFLLFLCHPLDSDWRFLDDNDDDDDDDDDNNNDKDNSKDDNNKDKN